MLSGKVVVVLCAIRALAASEISTFGDISVVESQADVCPGVAQPECVTSCVGYSNNDYQSCTSCHMYVTCSNGITYKDRPCPANLVWDDKKKLCDWNSATCPPQSGGFYMNLEDSDLGEDFIDGTTWQMLPGVPERDIAPPTATGACDTIVIYKFTPPACIKTVRFQVTTNGSADRYGYGVIDAYDISQTDLSYRSMIYPDFDISTLNVDFDYYTSYAMLPQHLITTPLCAQISPGVVSLSFSEGAGYTVTGDTLFQQMGAAPFFFTVNVDPYYMTPFSGGVCSLKVDWSC
ncbi:hypothetical protein NP493_762g01012 [Ridgeia piscesae]|uniref:Chitin-binding type-2 domain-containing protein n=1 Tax=Ridgeia piscesae TaxID=27915 RepID=A0AAD9NM25_RIDPI|nr:hypothetical protein NP493_762g01012 [Ridgeia piscesae]